MQLRRFSLPLASPLRTARTEVLDREGFAIGTGTGTDGSPFGVGEATPLPGWTESLPACEAALRDAAAAAASDPEPPADAEALLEELDPRETPAARHGVSLALADARARDQGRSLATRLVERHDLPEPAERVPVNATVGDGAPEAAARAAERALEDGYRCLKVKVGARPLDDDLDRLRAVRRAVGSGTTLRADANGGWDRGTARRALDCLRPLDLAYVEQPLPADDLAGHARLRADGDVPIALDESIAERGLRAVLDAAAADVAILKPMALGGPDRALDAALRARAAGVDPVVTTTIDGVVARTAAVHVAAAIPDVRPCGLATGGLLDDDLAADPCPVEEGSIGVPTDPGLAGDAFDGVV